MNSRSTKKGPATPKSTGPFPSPYGQFRSTSAGIFGQDETGIAGVIAIWLLRRLHLVRVKGPEEIMSDLIWSSNAALITCPSDPVLSGL